MVRVRVRVRVRGSYTITVTVGVTTPVMNVWLRTAWPPLGKMGMYQLRTATGPAQL